MIRFYNFTTKNTFWIDVYMVLNKFIFSRDIVIEKSIQANCHFGIMYFVPNKTCPNLVNQIISDSIPN